MIREGLTEKMTVSRDLEVLRESARWMSRGMSISGKEKNGSRCLEVAGLLPFWRSSDFCGWS